jgi:hypothetical protein
MHTLLNKTNVRKYTLYVASQWRPAVGFTRVSEAFLARVETELMIFISREIKTHPSKGVTIK